MAANAPPHKWVSRYYIPGKGWHYDYLDAHVPRVPNALDRARHLLPGMAPTVTPGETPPPAADGTTPPPDAAPAGPLRRPLIGRADPHAPAVGDDAVDHFLRASGAAVRRALLLYLHERCALAPLSGAFAALAPHLEDALAAGERAALADRPAVARILAAVRGDTERAAHLIAAARWIPAAHAIAAAAGRDDLGGELAHIARPRTGFPAYEAALDALQSLRETWN